MFRNLLSVVGVMALVLGLAGTGNADLYFEFDENGTNAYDSLNGPIFGGNHWTLTRIQGTRVANPAVNPVPNPDSRTFTHPTPGLTDGAAANEYSVSNPVFYRDTGTLQMRDDTKWTLEGWFRRDSDTTFSSNNPWGAMIAGTGGLNQLGWNLRMSPGGVILFQARDASSYVYVFDDSLPAYNDGDWHHFAVIWQGTSSGGSIPSGGLMQLYLDGTFVDAKEGKGAVDSGTKRFRVGYWLNTSSVEDNYWKDELDEFRFSDGKVLVPSQFLNYTSTDAPIAEPAGLGLLGLALLGLRKRRS